MFHNIKIDQDASQINKINFSSNNPFLHFRGYESDYKVMNEKEAPSVLFEKIFKTILRISTNQENKENFMTQEYYQNFLKDSNLFSIPMLFDLCVLYSNANSRALKDMIATQFKLNQNNYEQLSKIMPNFKKILNKLQSDLKTKKDNKKIVEEAYLYLLDFLASMSCFLEMFPRAVTIFQKSSQFVDLLTNIYSTWIPASPFQEKIGMMQRLTIKLIHDVMEGCYFSTIYNHSNEFNAQAGQHFLNVLEKLEQTMVKDESLLVAYHKKYNLKKKIDSMMNKGNHLKGKIDHFYNIISLYNVDKTSVVIHTSDKKPKSSSSSPTSKEDEMIQQVRSLFPKLGDGFILECLKFYKFSSESVIDALLNETLDLSLENLNRNMPRSKSKALSSLGSDKGKEEVEEDDSLTESDSSLSLSLSTTNLFDQLELNGTNFVAHKGKKQKENFMDLLADKSQLKWVKKYADNYDDDFDENAEGGGDGANDEFSIDPSETDDSDGDSDDDLPLIEEQDDPQQQNSNDPQRSNNNQPKNKYTRRKKTHNRKNMSQKKKGFY